MNFMVNIIVTLVVTCVAFLLLFLFYPRKKEAPKKPGLYHCHHCGHQDCHCLEWHPRS